MGGPPAGGRRRGGGREAARALSAALAGSRRPAAPGSLPWLTALVVAASAAVSFLPGLPGALQYDRVRVESGQLWLLLTGNMVHWSGRMAMADLVALLILGGLLESRRRLVAALCLPAGAAFTGAGVHLLLPGMDLYRGGSGMASALLVALAIDLVEGPSSRPARAAAALAGLIFAAKLIWEITAGQPVAAGALPAGVSVTPEVHFLGAVAGAASWAAGRRLARRRGIRRGVPGSSAR